MKRHLLFFIYCFCCFSAGTQAAFGKEACLLVPLTLEQRVEQSPLVVEGRVTAQQSFWDAARQRIYTSNTVALYKVFKGNTTGDVIEIITEGGQVGNDMHRHTGTLELSIGQSGVFFCIPHAVKGSPSGMNDASYMAYGSMQGYIRYDMAEGFAHDPFNRYDRINDVRQAIQDVTKVKMRIVKPVDKDLQRAELGQIKSKTTATPVIASFLPLAAPAGVGTLLTILGTNFGAIQGSGYVEFANANDGGASYVRPVASDYISWSDNQIVVRIPSSVVNPAGCAGTGNIRVTNSDPATGTSLLPLVITYAWTNLDDNGAPVRADMVNDNASGGYTFQYYTGMTANAPATAAFQRAMNSWCLTSVNWMVGATSSVNVAALDGTNIVRFDVGAELPAGNLGRLSSYYSGCGPVGGPFTWYVNEMDIVFDDGVNWQYGPALPTASQYDFESVALHELGHGLQLNHVINTLDVMHYALTNGQTRRLLNVDDLSGGSNVTSVSSQPNACGSSPMLLVPCPLPVQLISFSGKYLGEKNAMLTWKVANEEDLEGYIVEKSTNGERYEQIGFVKSNNVLTRTYSYTDNAFDQTSYYRLTVREKNGTVKYSNIVHLRLDGRQPGVNVYPNPVQNNITISSKDIDLNQANIIITGMDGRVAKSITIAGPSGMRDETIELDGLSPGVYLYKVETKGGVYTGKLVKE